MNLNKLAINTWTNWHLTKITNLLGIKWTLIFVISFSFNIWTRSSSRPISFVAKIKSYIYLCQKVICAKVLFLDIIKNASLLANTSLSLSKLNTIMPLMFMVVTFVSSHKYHVYISKNCQCMPSPISEFPQSCDTI